MWVWTVTLAKSSRKSLAQWLLDIGMHYACNVRLLFAARIRPHGSTPAHKHKHANKRRRESIRPTSLSTRTHTHKHIHFISGDFLVFHHHQHMIHGSICAAYVPNCTSNQNIVCSLSACVFLFLYLFILHIFLSVCIYWVNHSSYGIWVCDASYSFSWLSGYIDKWYKKEEQTINRWWFEVWCEWTHRKLNRIKNKTKKEEPQKKRAGENLLLLIFSK